MAAPKNMYVKEEYPYPSQFGSHASMIVEEETKRLHDDCFVICKDAFGMYVTEKANIDNGLADTYRNNLQMVNEKQTWRDWFLEKKMGEVFDIVE